MNISSNSAYQQIAQLSAVGRVSAKGTTRSADVQGAGTTSYIGDSTSESISQAGLAMSAAAQAYAAAHPGSAPLAASQPIPYPPGYPVAMQNALNQVFNNPNVSLQDKMGIGFNMVWGPAFGTGQRAPTDFSSPNFNARAYVNQWAKAFALSGNVTASRALDDISFS